MEGMEAVAFQIISNVGTAKSLIMEALYEARDGRYESAEKKLNPGLICSKATMPMQGLSSRRHQVKRWKSPFFLCMQRIK